jgi:FixJ family two-component response regulator
LNIKETEIVDAIKAAENKPQATTENLNEAPKTNDALRGLSAQENMDMMRIARDFGKGKLAEPLARTRLAAYGIDSETIDKILAQ